MSTELALKQNMLPTVPNPFKALGKLSPANDLANYIRFANSVPMLEKEEEIELAISLHKENNLQAAQKLILSHLRFVIKISRDLAGYGLSQADLIQEGTIGLMKAVKRFDPTQGVRLVTFAVHWVKAEMHEFIIKNWKIVKVATTKAQRKLFFKLRSSKSRLGWFTKDEINNVSKALNVSPEEVITMEQRMSAVNTTNSSSEEYDPLDNLTYNTNQNPEQLVIENNQQDQHNHALKCALHTLDNRSQEILRMRWLADKKSTLTELAKKYGVSAERIRQLEQEAMKKLKIQLSN
jgi:RNA polymerase sigma-32 factor